MTITRNGFVRTIVTSTTLIAASTTVTTTLQTISQCYDCSGPQCGKEGSFTSGNCPSCMAYRDPNDQSEYPMHSKRHLSALRITGKIERRCCWWACGAPNTVSTYNGVETYFCTGDKCNGDGVESMLSPPSKNQPSSNTVLIFYSNSFHSDRVISNNNNATNSVALL